MEKVTFKLVFIFILLASPKLNAEEIYIAKKLDKKIQSKKIVTPESGLDKKSTQKALMLETKKVNIKGQKPFMGKIKNRVQLHKEILISENFRVGSILEDSGLKVSFRMKTSVKKINPRFLGSLERFKGKKLILQFQNKVTKLNNIPRKWRKNWTLSFAISKIPKRKVLSTWLGFPIEVRALAKDFEGLQGLSYIKELRRLSLRVSCSAELKDFTLPKAINPKFIHFRENCSREQIPQAQFAKSELSYFDSKSSEGFKGSYLIISESKELNKVDDLAKAGGRLVLDPGKAETLPEWMRKIIIRPVE